MKINIKANVGEVLKTNTEFLVVTETKNGNVTDTRLLEFYIAQSIIIGNDDVGSRLIDLINDYSIKYLNNNNVIKVGG